MDVHVKLIKDMAFASLAETQNWVVMDTIEEFGGSGSGPKPMEMILMGLGGCTGMDVISILRKMKVKLDGFEIDVQAEQAEQHPKVYTKIHLTYRFYGKDIDNDKIEKAINLSQDKYCSVSAMLGKTAEIHHTVEIHPQQA
jgi:putative redox protein